jgi:uncharacterized membrane protein YdbT with pleckstrin-like domain
LESEQVLYRSHPSMFRNHPFWFLLWLILLPTGIGLIVMLVWLFRCLGTTLIISDIRTVNRKGILSISTTEVRHVDVKQLHTFQTFFQRMFGVGTIEIASAGTGDVEISERGLPHPELIISIIHKAQDMHDPAD